MSWDYGNSTSSLELLEDFSISNNNKNGSEPEANLTYNVITDQQSATHFALSIGTSVLLGMMTLTTIIGNIFVIAAIVLERNLQGVANYLILSLAVADLLVAVLVMPLAAVYEISNAWTFGPQLCDMWTSSDVLCCTASILHLVAIAVDRYWAVTQVHYIHSRTCRTIGTMICLIWGIAITVSLAPLFGWRDPNFEQVVNEEKTCIVSQDLGYQIFATMSTFYIPLVIILLLYWKIFMTARTRLRKRMAAKAQVDFSSNGAALGGPKKLVVEQKNCDSKPISRIEASHPPPVPTPTAAVSSSHTLHHQHSAVVVAVNEDEISSTNHSTTHQDLVRYVDQGCQTEKSGINNGHLGGHHQALAADDCSTPLTTAAPNNTKDLELTQPITVVAIEVPLPGSSSSAGAASKKHVSLEVKRERKAAKTLAIVTGAFIACWLPFFILALLMVIFKNFVFNHYLISFFQWMGYFNSTLNPIIYTIFSPEFRVAFKRILCGKSHVLNHRPRHLQ